MILRTRGGGAFSTAPDPFLTAGSPIPPPTQNPASLWAGRAVTMQDVKGLPAVMKGVRLIAETCGTLPLVVYSEDEHGNRLRASKSSQWTLFYERPNAIQTPFDFKAYIVACLLGFGNAYLYKEFGPARTVRGLWPLDPRRVTPKVEGNDITYQVRPATAVASPQTLTRGEIVHIRGLLVDENAFVGVSPFVVHAQALGIAVSAEEFAGRFYNNDGTPGGIVIPSQPTTPVQRAEFRESWEARHRGVSNSHRIGLLPFAGDFKQLGVSAQDAQLIAAREFTREEVALILNLPAGALGVSSGSRAAPPPPQQENMRLVTFGLAPWFVRIEQALYADNDVFPGDPQNTSSYLKPEFLVDALLRADQPSRYSMYLPGRQAGWLTANEVRAKENLPPHPDGDSLQQTPVGGAPNAGDSTPDPEGIITGSPEDPGEN